MISIIVAAASNNVIGKDNSLIWHLPADMKFFKEKTAGQCVITGRKNYESIPEKFRPLPNRTNIVITRQQDYQAPGAIVVDSIEKALEKATYTELDVFIIGGGEIYRQAIKYTDMVYLTRIHHEFEGDVHLDPLTDEWVEVDRVSGPVDEKNKYAHDYITYKRRDQ